MSYYAEFSPLLDAWYVEPLSKTPGHPFNRAIVEGEVINIYLEKADSPQDAITQADKHFSEMFPDLYPNLRPQKEGR